MAKYFAEKLKQANLAAKKDIDNFVKKTYLDEKMIIINKKVTSDKTKQVEVKKKVIYHVTFHTELKNNLSREIKLK